MSEWIVAIIKSLKYVVLCYLFYKLMFPVLNKKMKVRYPNVTVNLVGRRMRKDKLIEYCAIKMYKGGVREEEIMRFIRAAFQTKDKRQLLELCAHLFYIY